MFRTLKLKSPNYVPLSEVGKEFSKSYSIVLKQLKHISKKNRSNKETHRNMRNEIQTLSSALEYLININISDCQKPHNPFVFKGKRIKISNLHS
jgi:hypothetical protein